MATLTQLKSRVVSKLGLDSTQDDTLLTDWANEAVEDILVKTRCNVASGTMSFTANENDYELDTDILRLLDLFVTNNGNDFRMERRSVQEILDYRRASASSTASAPARFYAVAGSNLLMVYPTPASADTLTIYYVPRPTALSAGGDIPTSIPTEFHKLVELYMLSEGADYDDDGSSGNGTIYLARYEAGLRRLKQAVMMKGGTRLAPGVVGSRRRLLRHDNSQDVFE